MRVLVCGGRDYKWRSVAYSALDKFKAKKGISLLITGSGMGADALAEEWAKLRCVPYLGVPAKWKEHGKKAGPMRNEEMLKEWKPDAVIAFPGGNGTKHMVRLAKKSGVNVWEIPD